MGRSIVVGDKKLQLTVLRCNVTCYTRRNAVRRRRLAATGGNGWHVKLVSASHASGLVSVRHCEVTETSKPGLYIYTVRGGAIPKTGYLQSLAVVLSAASSEPAWPGAN